jgi:U3 small nucleolar RNA-associated protein 14
LYIRRWLIEKRAAAEKEKLQRLGARADAKLKGVVISEKWDKKASKFTVMDLPFPYTSKEVRYPVGRKPRIQILANRTC